MRLALRSALLTLALYLAVIGGVAVWMEYSLRVVAQGMMASTARLIGREMAAAIEALPGSMLPTDPATRRRLEKMVGEITDRSEVVASMTVVDASGRVLASDDPEQKKQRLAPVAEVFGERPSAELEQANNTYAHDGRYRVLIPIELKGRTTGYLRVALRSRHIADLYSGAQHQLFLIAIIGLGGVAVLALLLHLQLYQRGTALARVLEHALEGQSVRTPLPRDEFAHAFEAAGRLGRELQAARHIGTRASQRLDVLAEIMNVGVVLLGAKQELEFANPRALQLFGCGSDAELMDCWRRLALAPEGGAAATRDEPSCAWHFDVEVPQRGQTHLLRIDLYPLEEEPYSGYLALVRDRRALSSLETDLLLATQLRTLSRLYLASAHELKAPLNAMGMNIDLLEGTIEPAADSEHPGVRESRLRYLRVLKQELARLDRSLRMLMTSAAQPSNVAQKFDLRDLIGEIAALLGAQVKHQRVELAVDTPEQPVLFTGHRDRLKQAFLNVAINALEAMPSGGKLGIALQRSDGRAEIAVRDSGPGISPEVLAKIGEMHFTTKESGTGVGLYVTRSVVESAGGSVHIETQAGQGTCFQISLPVPEGEA